MKKQVFLVSALSTALTAAFPQVVMAQQEVDEFVNPNTGTLTFGAGQWSDKRPQQGRYEGTGKKGSYETLDGSYVNRDEATGTWTSLYMKNLGLSSGEFGGRYETQGDWGINFNYSQIRTDNPLTINTGLQGIGTNQQTIRAVAPGAGADVSLSMQRDATGLGFFKRFSPELEFRVNFKEEEKTGNRQWGVRDYPTIASTAGSYPAFIAEPISATTRQLDAVVNYQDKKLSITGGYYGSWYNNKNSSITVRGTANGITDVTLPPDNQAHQVYLRGNYAITPTTRSLFKLAYTHATQNQSFINTANNNVAAWAPLATTGSQLNGVVDTTDALLNISSRPMKDLSLRAEGSYYDRNDKTPVRLTITGGYHNNPFRFTNRKGKLEGDYRLSESYSLNAGFDVFHQERTIDKSINGAVELFVPYRQWILDKTTRIALRRSMSEELSGSVGYSFSNRTGAHWNQVNASVDSATMTPVYLADRQRDKVKFAADWTPNQDFGIQGTFSYTKDNYPTKGERADGVRQGHAQIFTLDANWVVTDNWKTKAWYSLESIRTHMTGPVNGTTDWIETQRDYGESIGLGIDGKLSGAWTVGAKLDVTLSRGDFTQTPGSTSPLPAVMNRESRINLFADYAIEKNSSVRIDLISDHYRTDDWQWRFSNGNIFSYATEGTQVINYPNQSATFVGVRYTYKFQ